MAVVEGNNEEDEGKAILPLLYVSEPVVMKLWLKHEKRREKSKKKNAKNENESVILNGT